MPRNRKTEQNFFETRVRWFSPKNMTKKHEQKHKGFLPKAPFSTAFKATWIKDTNHSRFVHKSAGELDTGKYKAFYT